MPPTDVVLALIQVDESGEILNFSCSCPWKEHLYELEKEMGIDTPIKYCLYQVSFTCI